MNPKPMQSDGWVRWSAVASVTLGIVCGIKAVTGFSGPLSESASMTYRLLVVVGLPLVMSVWIMGLRNLPLGMAGPLGNLGFGIAAFGLAYVMVIGLDQYFLHLVPIGIPWAGVGYLAFIFGALVLGIAIVVSRALPVWGRGLPPLLTLALPLLMLARTPEDAVAWTVLASATGVGFLALGRVLLRSSSSGVGKAG